MIPISATEQEWQALGMLIDAAVRSLGIRGAGTAVQWVARIETAINEARKPREPSTAD